MSENLYICGSDQSPITMSIRCLAVDDEQHALDIISRYVEKIPNLELVAATTDAIEAFQLVQKEPIDLVFLDVHMPEITGIQFLKLLGGRTKVILCTAYPEYALEGYDLDIVDYLLKPMRFERFLKAVQKAQTLLEAEEQPKTASTSTTSFLDDYIFVKTETKGKLLKVVLSEIRYVEGLGNYVSIFTDDKRIVTLLTIKELEERLPKTYFLRVHKSYIVALGKIQGIDGNQIMVAEGHIPLGDTYREAFFNGLQQKIVASKK
ncbi:LytR/AlgR family response regulator transcription factor [Runella limosa]|uniref:LytR/AlgR family response regulator transcription factor n=1 Tax=Runella limosa TaxID=370978 RepID=UPI001E5D9AF3|nr:LytTR family DNA-binding domain-containing protein [Runella limosa]